MDISNFQAIVYGIVQGLTEFLPVSSSAHLRIIPALLHWQDPGSAFTAVIQLGTTLALLIYFAKDLKADIGAWAKSLGDKELRNTPEARMGWAVFYGTLPIIILAFPLHHKIETTFRSLYIIAGSMIVMGIVMLIAQNNGRRNRSVETVETKDGWLVGAWQCLSLIPGMSRSGSTISGALFAGFDNAAAAKFSFLLSVPSVTAAGLYEAYSNRHEMHGILVPVIIATVVSFIVGYAAIAGFMGYIRKKGIGGFVVYRIVLGILLIGLVQAKILKPDEGAPDVKKDAPVAAASVAP